MRRARTRSKNGFYHTVIRGVNKQNIFYCNADKRFFRSLMRKYGKKYKVLYHSYCILDNHVHFLLEDLKGNLSQFMQSIASVYARYFNKKYDRIGHLYQDRFASEPVEHNRYFVIVVRYIVQNPQKAGICKASVYRWSSYNSYKRKDPLVKSSTILGLFGNIEKLYKFLDDDNSDECLDLSLRPSEKQSYIINKIKKLLGLSSPIIDQSRSRKEIIKQIVILRKAGISIRNITRITGVSRWLVQSCK